MKEDSRVEVAAWQMPSRVSLVLCRPLKLLGASAIFMPERGKQELYRHLCHDQDLGAQQEGHKQAPDRRKGLLCSLEIRMAKAVYKKELEQSIREAQGEAW